jgi:hypothetical protein
MPQVPKGVWFSVGVALLAVVAAAIAARTPPAPSPDAVYGSEFADSCFRYGRFECCVRGDDDR